MSIEGACEDFVSLNLVWTLFFFHNFFFFFQLQGGDSGVFLVAVSDRVQSGDSEEVARTVLQEKYQVCSCKQFIGLLHS